MRREAAERGAPRREEQKAEEQKLLAEQIGAELRARSEEIQQALCFAVPARARPAARTTPARPRRTPTARARARTLTLARLPPRVLRPRAQVDQQERQSSEEARETASALNEAESSCAGVQRERRRRCSPSTPSGGRPSRRRLRRCRT